MAGLQLWLPPHASRLANPCPPPTHPPNPPNPAPPVYAVLAATTSGKRAGWPTRVARKLRKLLRGSGGLGDGGTGKDAAIKGPLAGPDTTLVLTDGG